MILFSILISRVLSSIDYHTNDKVKVSEADSILHRFSYNDNVRAMRRSGLRDSYFLRIGLLIICVLTLTFSQLGVAQFITRFFSVPDWKARLRDNWENSRGELQMSAGDSIFSVLGRWAWGPCEAVDVQGNYAYIGNGPTFQVLDVSNPSSPTIVGEYLIDKLVQDIAVRGTFAYVLSSAALVVMDVSNPQAPTKLSELGITGGPEFMALSDSFAYVTSFLGGFRVIDISNPSFLQSRGSISLGAERPTFVATKDRYAYVGLLEMGDQLIIIDATNPDSLQRTLINTGKLALAGIVVDTVLYVASTGNEGFYLNTFTVNNPASPVQLGEMSFGIPENQYVSSVAVNRNFAYISTQDFGIYSVDVNNPAIPILRGHVQHRDFALPPGLVIRTNDSSAFAAYYSGLWIVDITDNDSLREKTFFPTGGDPGNIVLSDNYAFIASGLSGLWIVDISDVTRPRGVSNIYTGGYTAGAIVYDSLVYIVNWGLFSPVDTARGLWVLNVSDIAHPEILSHHIGIARYSGWIHENSIAKEGNAILMTQILGVQDSILEFIDVSNPRQPVQLSVFRAHYAPYYVAVQDSFAYLATADSGLKIIDIRDPLNPLQVGSVLSYAIGIVVKDTFAHVLNDTLFVINVSNANHPFIVGRTATRGGIESFRGAINNNFLYWAERDLGVVDISDPEHPIQRGIFSVGDDGKGVAVKGDTVFFTAQGRHGLWILKNNLGITSVNEKLTTVFTQLELYQNYPNPFNPTTIITFSLPKRSPIVLEIFNLLGQRVATLIDGVIDSGVHQSMFDASRFSAGVYFYRLKTPETVVVKKLLLIH